MPIINGKEYTEEQIRRMEEGFGDYRDVRDSVENMEVSEEYGYEYPGPGVVINGERYTEDQIRRMEEGFGDYRDVRDSAEHMESEEEYEYSEPTPEPNPEPTPEPNPEPTPKEDLERTIAKFKEDSEKMKKAINDVKRTLVLDDSTNLDISEAIRGLDSELAELENEANDIIRDIDEFKATTEEAEFSMTPAEIKKVVKDFKKRIKELKQHQINKYDARVDATNRKIEELKGMDNLDPEISKMLDSLKLDRIGIVIDNYKTNYYLSDINYNRLAEVNRQLNEIENKIKDSSDKDTTLEEDIIWIETTIRRIGIDLKDNISKEEWNGLNQEISLVAKRINEFNEKLKLNKDVLSKGDYEIYFTRVNDAQANLAELYDKLMSIREVDLEADMKAIEDGIVAIDGKIKDEMSLEEVKEINEDIDIIVDKIDIFRKDLESNKDKLSADEYKNYLDRLNDAQANLAELYNKLPKELNLEADMKAIEDGIVSIEAEIKDEMALDEIKKVKQDIEIISNRIKDFRVKLENNKDKISPEEYQSYLDRLNAAQAKLEELYNKLPKLQTNDYQELMEKLEKLAQEVNYFDNLIESLHGYLDEKCIEVFSTEVSTFAGRLDEIKNEIEERYKEGKLDDNQYNELKKKIEEIEKTLESTRNKLKDPEVMREVDIFAFLNKKIDGLELAIDELEKQVDALEKPIKDRNIIKQIDKIIEELEKEIKFLEDTLEHYKDEDSEKYRQTKERLNKVKDRLDKVGKKYRKKCPLLVRGVKAIGNFYKKNKKTVLIVGGLAAMSILMSPVLIPAIMHGNIMIGTAAPALSGFTSFVNNILGGIIGATKTPAGAWMLSSGVKINPTLASTSLLKGVAVVGSASIPYVATLVAPFIGRIKNLIEKQKKKLKKDEVEEKTPKKKRKKEKTEEKKEEKKEEKTITKNKLERLLEKLYSKHKKQNSKYKKQMKSGKTFEEFCKEENLTPELISLLEQKIKLEEMLINGTQNIEKPSGRRK